MSNRENDNHRDIARNGTADSSDVRPAPPQSSQNQILIRKIRPGSAATKILHREEPKTGPTVTFADQVAQRPVDQNPNNAQTDKTKPAELNSEDLVLKTKM